MIISTFSLIRKRVVWELKRLKDNQTTLLPDTLNWLLHRPPQCCGMKPNPIVNLPCGWTAEEPPRFSEKNTKLSFSLWVILLRWSPSSSINMWGKPASSSTLRNCLKSLNLQLKVFYVTLVNEEGVIMPIWRGNGGGTYNPVCPNLPPVRLTYASGIFGWLLTLSAGCQWWMLPIDFSPW